ncbi:MAG: hypothetical protein ACFFD8_00630 [Candidatus Thorarchaeota archaeon]
MITAEELLERILILTTVNSTLIHALITIEAEGDLGTKQINQLAQGVSAVRESVKQALSDSKNNHETSGSSFVDDTINVILTHLERIEKALGSLAKSKVTKITTAKIKEPIAAAQQLVAEATQDLAGLTGKPFQRRLSIHDPKKLLPPIQQLLDKYSSRSHLLLPNFWYEACRELFRYSEPREVINEITQIASQVFYNLTRRLLAEAPCAGLLQELLRKGTIGTELTSRERNKIAGTAIEFYEQLSSALEGNSVEASINEAKRNLRSFDWGPADVEKRVIGVIHRSAKELIDRAVKDKSLSNFERVTNAELSRYICSLAADLHNLPRFTQLLTDMKV